MIVLTTPTDDQVSNVPAIPVFSLDGVEYTMPAEIPGWLLLKVLDMMRTQSEAAAVAWALEQLLGKGYHALLNFKSLSKEELAGVLAIVKDKLMGAMETVQGN